MTAESGSRVLEDRVLELPLGSCSMSLGQTNGKEAKLGPGVLLLQKKSMGILSQ